MDCSCKFSTRNRFEGLPDDLSPRILSGFSKTDLHSILSVSRHQQFVAPSVVVHQGDAAERMFLLTSGQGAHFVITNEGRKVLLHWLTAGQIFGGATMLSVPSHYLASAEMQTNSCALVWDRRIIRELISRFPLLLDNALSIATTEHIAWLMSARVSLGTEDARVRIARLLVSLASGIGKSCPDGIEIQVGNDDLASGANVTPYTVSRSLGEWQRDGILTKRRGKVVLHRAELLLA
jgi:CRP-like cAMP-binding protein